MKKATKPRQGRRTRPTSLSLQPATWIRLKEIEEETGVKPSTTVQRVLDKTVGRAVVAISQS